MDSSIFRAYSIRGVADQTLTADDMRLIGQAFGTLFADMAAVVVGHDYRLSSSRLAAALEEGLLSTGLNVIDIAPCTTPMLNFATDHYRADAGLMVTASHNPARYNGLKIRTDHSLDEKELLRIYEVAVRGAFRQGQGIFRRESVMDDYLAAIYRSVKMARRWARPLTVVVDAGNGAAGPLIPTLVEKLGGRAILLYCDPDGRFPNRAPDPTAPGALDALSARVVAEGADAGLAYDGDGDRLSMVDERGSAVFGDQLLTLLAQQALRTQPGEVIVYELSCTQALAETVEALGGRAIPCPVGYAFVHQAMRTHHAILGGEAAGHLFFAEPNFAFDDAALATARMLSLLSQTADSLSQLLAALPEYHLSPEHRLECPDDQKRAVVAAVGAHFAGQGYAIEHMDGAKVRFSDGWALFRCSNTQPAVTLRCEAKTLARLETIEQLMLDAVCGALTAVGMEMHSAH